MYQTNGGESRSAVKDPLCGGDEVAPAEQTTAKRGEEVLEERARRAACCGEEEEEERSVCLRPALVFLCWHSAHLSC